jgi:iron complex transport system ATP-binding protein
MANPAQHLRAEGVSVTLGGRDILKDIDLAFAPGEVTALLGPNGAGKSTLLTCLAGLRAPGGGRVVLEGSAILSLSPKERARRIAYLPQTPEIAWGLDVRTFVRLGRTAHRGVFGESPADAAAVDEALALNDLAAFAARDIRTLSGGERARAHIARALAGEPAWLVADEPLTGLDLGHQLDAADLLKAAAARGVGVVVSVHDLQFAVRVADRIVVLREGRILADGPAAEALTSEVLAQAYAVDAHWVAGQGGALLDVVSQRDPA